MKRTPLKLNQTLLQVMYKNIMQLPSSYWASTTDLELKILIST